MVVGVVMVTVVPGEERPVYGGLGKIHGVKDIFHVFGECDFIVILDVDGLSVLNTCVDKIREIRGVTATKTIIGAEL